MSPPAPQQKLEAFTSIYKAGHFRHKNEIILWHKAILIIGLCSAKSYNCPFSCIGRKNLAHWALWDQREKGIHLLCELYPMNCTCSGALDTMFWFCLLFYPFPHFTPDWPTHSIHQSGILFPDLFSCLLSQPTWKHSSHSGLLTNSPLF